MVRLDIDMRELALLETVYLAGMLLLSLGPPLMMSLRGQRTGTARRSCLRTISLGQLLCAFAGVVVLASAALSPYAATFALVSGTWCVLTLRRQFRTD